MTKVASRHPLVAGARFANSIAPRRYPLIAAVELDEPVTRIRLAGVTSSISDTDCEIHSNDSLAPGTVVQMAIEGSSGSFRTWARVACASQGGGMTLDFFDTDPAQRELLKKWIDDLKPEGV